MADVRWLPAPHVAVWDWQLRAECRGLGSEVFFHPSDERGPARTRREEQAKDICGRCPVLERCRQHALDTREPYGVWGGLTEGERRILLFARSA